MQFVIINVCVCLLYYLCVVVVVNSRTYITDLGEIWQGNSLHPGLSRKKYIKV